MSQQSSVWSARWRRPAIITGRLVAGLFVAVAVVMAAVTGGAAQAGNSTGGRAAAAAAARSAGRLAAARAASSNCVAWTGFQPPAPGPRLAGVAAISACNAWAVGENGMIEHWNGASWMVVPSSTSGSLTGVAATSSANAWAVGPGLTANHGLILHWNGTAWKQQATPVLPSKIDILNGVAATSARNAWAVGTVGIDLAARALIEHWNGTTWKRTASPVPPGTRYAVLYGVAATSARNAWAVGTYNIREPHGSKDLTLIEHWNGRSWKRVASPNPRTSSAGTGLRGVSASSASNAWAVGTYADPNRTLTEHWNGTVWKLVASPNLDAPDGPNVLFGVAAISAGNAWAVGFYAASNGDPDHTLVEHWNGRTWRHVNSPDLENQPGDEYNDLFAVAATSASNVWAVGYAAPGDGGGPVQPLALHCC